MSDRHIRHALEFVAAAIMVSVLVALDSPFWNYLWMILALAIASVCGERKAVEKCP